MFHDKYLLLTFEQVYSLVWGRTLIRGSSFLRGLRVLFSFKVVGARIFYVQSNLSFRLLGLLRQSYKRVGTTFTLGRVQQRQTLLRVQLLSKLSSLCSIVVSWDEWHFGNDCRDEFISHDDLELSSNLAQLKQGSA